MIHASERTLMNEYGITIDGEFHVINKRRAPIRGPYGRTGRWERFWGWIRKHAKKLKPPEW